LKVSRVQDAEAAVDTLAGLVLSEGLSVAEPFGSVGRLLKEFGCVEQQGWVDQRAVAVLAAARRFEEARAALARYRPVADYREGDREARRFVHQVGR